ncbi:hypothetical protein QQ045_023015 [Rhodiola kirilowii]
MADDTHAPNNNKETTTLDDESCTFASVSGRNFWIPKCSDELKPHVGMIIPNLNQAVLFYKQYARIAGFVVRLSTSNRSGRIVTLKYLMCQRESFKGKSKVVDTLNSDRNERSRRDTRCECEARVLENITDGGRYHKESKKYGESLGMHQRNECYLIA